MVRFCVELPAPPMSSYLRPPCRAASAPHVCNLPPPQYALTASLRPPCCATSAFHVVVPAPPCVLPALSMLRYLRPLCCATCAPMCVTCAPMSATCAPNEGHLRPTSCAVPGPCPAHHAKAHHMSKVIIIFF